MSEENSSALRPRPKNIAERVRELLFPVVLEAECYLWDVEYVKEGAEMILRVVIDSNEGITLDDCERVTRAIDPVLDEADPIENSYRLEVTSPGVERPLTRNDHFEACIGDEIEVRLFAPLNGAKTLRGTLSANSEKDFSVTLPDGSAVTLQKSAAAKVSTVFAW
jgi:ribosome maturation factor RimP